MILRMSNVPALDITAMNGLSRLYDQCQKNGIKLIFSHVNAQPMTVIKKAGLFDMMGSDCFQPNIDAAIQESARCK